jgi:hypothetical protein
MKKIFTFPHFVHVPLPTLFLLFASGFAMLVVQIMGTRVLGPFVGTALPVWASLIGTTLIGGAIGYYAGGTLADTRQSTKMSFMIASLAAVSIVLIPLFRDTVLNLLGTLTYMQVTLLSAIILFLPPALFLSMLVTYAIRIHVTDMESIAQVHGDLYAVATLGSIVGVFATSYYLIPTFTVPHILYGVGIFVFFLGSLNSWITHRVQEKSLSS